MICRVLYIPGGAGFLPSTVLFFLRVPSFLASQLVDSIFEALRIWSLWSCTEGKCSQDMDAVEGFPRALVEEGDVLVP